MGLLAQCVVYLVTPMLQIHCILCATGGTNLATGVELCADELVVGGGVGWS